MSKHLEKIKAPPISSIHTSRTLMFAELARVMDFGAQDGAYEEALLHNVTGKSTRTNQEKTSKYLQQLYGFNPTEAPFAAFRYFWQIAPTAEKPLLAFLYALGRDYLLAESARVTLNVQAGDKVSVAGFEENLEKDHPGRFSPNTRKSVAQNLASSWKQAGYITGKVKNIRSKTNPGYLAAAFALLLSYLHGDRGDYILASKWAKALDMSEERLRELTFEAAKRELLSYQFSGEVTTISFQNLLNKLNVHGDRR